MRKYLAVTGVLCAVCVWTTGCLDKGAAQTARIETVGDVEMEGAAPQSAGSETTGAEGVDLDLTALSSTMVFAEVYNIMMNPDDYTGKIIKVRGPYVSSYYDETGQYYHYVMIKDAAACCQNGLEFKWSGEHVYPDDYPAEEADIEIAGVFKSYEELGETFYYLAVNDISV